MIFCGQLLVLERTIGLTAITWDPKNAFGQQTLVIGIKMQLFFALGMKDEEERREVKDASIKCFTATTVCTRDVSKYQIQLPLFKGE